MFLTLIMAAFVAFVLWFLLGRDQPSSEGSMFVRNAQNLADLMSTGETEPTVLMQSDFASGPVHLTDPGCYCLGEDIVFEPPEEGPPEDAGSEFVLGWFAAVIITGTGIVLDLRGHEIKQGDHHYLHQRFFSVVELADTPFIPGQGPAPFKSTITPAADVMICNGTIGTSSHHAIHGNMNTNVVLKDLVIQDFEIAGVHLNGVTGLLARDVQIGPIKTDVPVNAMFSQAHFVRLLMTELFEQDPSLAAETVAIHSAPSGSLTGAQVLAALETALADPATHFPSDQGFSDGNVYGMVINSVGVAVDALPTETGPTLQMSRFCDLQNVTIQGIESKPVEVPALGCDTNVVPFGMVVQKGPFGDVFRLLKDQDGLYAQRPLSDAQLFLGAHTDRTSIGHTIIGWAGQNTLSLEDYETAHNCQCTIEAGGDSMAHVMKGTFGMMVEQSDHVRCTNVTISGVRNHADASTVDQPAFAGLGGSAAGVVVSGCGDHVDVSGIQVSDVTAANGDATDKIEDLPTAPAAEPAQQARGCPFGFGP